MLQHSQPSTQIDELKKAKSRGEKVVPDQESKLAHEDEYRQRLLELQQQLSCVPSPTAAFVEESIGPSRAVPPSGSRALHSLESSVSSPSLPALPQQHSAAPASAAPAPATFKFLLPKDY